MWDISDIEDSESRLPIRSVDESATVSGVIGVLTGPSLDCHIVNVNPATVRGFPRDFSLTHLDNAGKVTISREIEMSDGDSSTRLTRADIALFVVRVCDEDVPLSVNHLCVEIVRSARMVCIVPRVDIFGVSFVGHIDKCDADLCWVTPLSDIWVTASAVNQLILDDYILTPIVFEILDIEHLSVRVEIDSYNRRVVWVGHIDNVHLFPAGYVGVGVAVGAVSDLKFCVSGLCQRVEVGKLNIGCSEFMLGGIPMVMFFILKKWVN